jgi:hypothetical protein
MAKLTHAQLVAKKKIYGLDLTDIVATTATQEGWKAKARAVNAERWYKNFLFMCYLDRSHPLLVLGDDADKVWHYHVLQTRRYRNDCNAIFDGDFLDHDPLPGNPKPTPTPQQIAETRARCRELFHRNAPDLVVHCTAPPPPPI